MGFPPFCSHPTKVSARNNHNNGYFGGFHFAAIPPFRHQSSFSASFLQSKNKSGSNPQNDRFMRAQKYPPNIG
jgi:hypothetical protein